MSFFNPKSRKKETPKPKTFAEIFAEESKTPESKEANQKAAIQVNPHKQTQTELPETEDSKQSDKKLVIVPLNDDVLDMPKDAKKHEKAFYYKKPVDMKLTIILIENTAKVHKEKETLIKIVNNLVTSGLVCVINYGTKIRICDSYDFDFNSKLLLCDDDIVDSACLYDALINLGTLISAKYMTISEKEKEQIRINKIEIIGIGTCKDSGSKSSKETAIEWFYEATDKPDITTKYFCLTEENFINAAEIGFRSIGAISRNYQ